MIYYKVTVKDYSTRKKNSGKFTFRNKHLIKEHLKMYDDAYVEIEMNRCIETFYIKKYNQEIWIEI